MISYREIAHTADIGLEIYGRTLEELFVNGAKGLCHLLFKDFQPFLGELNTNKTSPQKLELSAESPEELLVQWLNEYIYRLYVENLYPGIIDSLKISAKNLSANIVWETLNSGQKPSVEIKAATYCDLKISKENDMYKTKVIFDV